MSNIRIEKVQHLIREKLGNMIITGVIKDPRVNSFISITDVEVSRDTAHAKVFISSFESEKKIEAAVNALNHAAGFIQGKLGKQLHMRNTPKLIFIKDDSVRHGVEMIKKIDGLSH